MEFIITKDHLKKVPKRKFIYNEFYGTNKVVCEWCRGHDLVLVVELNHYNYLAFYTRLTLIDGYWAFSEPTQVWDLKKYKKLKANVSKKMKKWFQAIDTDFGFKLNQMRKRGKL